MEIDNSRAKSFRLCPWLYYEEYERDGTGLEKKPGKYDEPYGPLEFGARGHELMEEHYTQPGKYPAHANPDLENEAQLVLAAYRTKYPQEDFEVVDVEKSFKVELPKLCSRCFIPPRVEPNQVWCDSCGAFAFDQHIYTGKMDLVVRSHESGRLNIIDHKFEKRSAKSNAPQKWAARDQASLYLWAAERIYGEPIENFIVNVLTRPSEKLQVGPTFPERQKLERTPEQIETSVRDIVYVADQIERMRAAFGDKPWPANREQCVGWGQCNFYLPHTFGWSDEIKATKYQPKSEYLDLKDVEVVR